LSDDLDTPTRHINSNTHTHLHELAPLLRGVARAHGVDERCVLTLRECAREDLRLREIAEGMSSHIVRAHTLTLSNRSFSGAHSERISTGLKPPSRSDDSVCWAWGDVSHRHAVQQCDTIHTQRAHLVQVDDDDAAQHCATRHASSTDRIVHQHTHATHLVLPLPVSPTSSAGSSCCTHIASWCARVRVCPRVSTQCMPAQSIEYTTNHTAHLLEQSRCDARHRELVRRDWGVCAIAL
jgi:hypothetical protein